MLVLRGRIVTKLQIGINSYRIDQITSTTKLALESVCMEAFVIADCAESVLTQDAEDPVDRMLPVPFSKSPVLRCFFSFNPYNQFLKKLINSFSKWGTKVGKGSRRLFGLLGRALPVSKLRGMPTVSRHRVGGSSDRIRLCQQILLSRPRRLWSRVPWVHFYVANERRVKGEFPTPCD